MLLEDHYHICIISATNMHSLDFYIRMCSIGDPPKPNQSKFILFQDTILE